MRFARTQLTYNIIRGPLESKASKGAESDNSESRLGGEPRALNYCKLADQSQNNDYWIGKQFRDFVILKILHKK